MKTCTKCSRSLPVDQFRQSGQYLRSSCRDCANEASRRYGIANRDRRNERLRAWRAANPEKARAKERRSRLSSKYNLTEQQHAAILARFDGMCWVCRARPAIVIDHDHQTGLVRGAACHGCNSVVLARIDADPAYLGRVAAYLDQPCHADVLLELANR